MNRFTLGEIADQNNGVIQTGPFGSQLHSYDYVADGIPVVMPQDIVNNRIDLSKISYIEPSLAQTLKKHYLRSGDIVFPRRGDIGKCAIFEDSSRLMICGTGCLKISIPEKQIHTKWLFYYLMQDDVIKYIENNAVGSTMLNLNTGILRSVEISLPDLETQKKIASILSNYDDLIQTNQQRIALLEEAAQRLYDEWFVKSRFPNHEQVPVVDGVPEGWERVTLSKLVDLINGYPFKPSELGEEGYPIIKIPELRSGILATTPRNDGSQIPTKYFVNHGDIIFSWSGTILIDEWGYDKAILNQHLFNVVPYQKERKSFIRLAIQQAIPEMVGHAIGSTMMHLRRGTVDNYQLLLPSEILLSKFCMMVDNIFYQSSILKKQNQKLAQARDALLPRLMSGKIDVSGLSLKEIA